MSIITVRTTQNIDIDYEVGGLGERMLSFLLDISIFAALAIVGGILSGYVTHLVIQVYYISLSVLLLFYDLVCEVSFNGQSLGKYLMKIRVISLNGSRPTFSQYLLRWLFRLVDCLLTSYLAATAAIIITDKSQRVGDIVAGTIVIRTIARAKMKDIIFTPTDNEYQLVFPEVTELKDGDINLIRDVMDNYFKTGNTSVVYEMADKIRAYLKISLPPGMNSMQFLQTVVKDYTHLSSQADLM